MDKRKICFVVSSPGTASSFLKEPIRRLSQYYDVFLVANFPTGKEPDGFEIKGWKSIKIERRPHLSVDVKALIRLYKFFRGGHFYAVHSYTLKASLLTAIAGFFARVPHRIRNFSGQLWCNMTGMKRRFYKMIEHIIVTLDTDFMVDCNAQRQYLIDQGILKNPGQAVIPANGSVCGIDIDHFAFDPEKRRNIRLRIGIDESRVVFIFLGRLRKEKGIFELFQAFNDMALNHPEAFLLLVGNEEEPCIERLPDYPNIRLGDNACFFGYTTDPPLLLHAGDVFVLPTYREGFGLSVLEASCVGLPVICSDTYGVMDAMVDNVTGLRCKTYDSESLRECMETMIENPGLRKELGSNGRQRVIRDFPRELVMQAWVDFYKRIDRNE